MSTPRRIPLALSAALALAALYACGFPNPSLREDAGPTEAGPTEAGPTEAGPADARTDAIAPGCDQDNDGVSSVACGGKDCNDNDPRVKPGASFLDDVPTIAAPPPPAGNGGDWDCSGTVEKEFRTNLSSLASLDCAAKSAADCEKTSGFLDDPACGAQGRFVACKKQGSSCIVDLGGSNQKTMRCK